ncbi:glycoside hydrolase superfamily [Zopfochytrium polystomum]|nr:glycoside hydrolase superfamily [Zopfochytrium polystomum]
MPLVQDGRNNDGDNNNNNNNNNNNSQSGLDGFLVASSPSPPPTSNRDTRALLFQRSRDHKKDGRAFEKLGDCNDNASPPTPRELLTRGHKIVLAVVLLALVAVAATTTALYVQSLRSSPSSSKSGEEGRLASAAATSFGYRPFTKPGVIAYYANWAPYSRPQNNVDKLDLEGVSVMIYSFLNLKADGSVESSDSASDATNVPLLNKQVRNKYPSLLTSIAVGGWSLSRYFSTVAADETLTRAFATNIHAYMDQNGFDGVDIDYEYPGGGASCNVVNANDRQNMVRFFRILREELGSDRLISFAISVNPSQYFSDGVNYLTQYAQYVSYFGVMSYDIYLTSISPYADFNSPLGLPGGNDNQRPAKNGPGFSISTNIEAIIGAGVSPSKLVAGLAFYGHSWSVVSKGSANGLFQACDKPGQDTSSASPCPIQPGDYLDATPSCDPCVPSSCSHTGSWSYLNLRGNSGTQRGAPLTGGPTSAGNGWSRQYVDWAASPTLFNPSFQATDANGANVAGSSPCSAFISYDDPVSIGFKSAWAKNAGLGGVMAWEVSQDFQNELLTAMKSGWADGSVGTTTSTASTGSQTSLSQSPSPDVTQSTRTNVLPTSASNSTQSSPSAYGPGSSTVTVATKGTNFLNSAVSARDGLVLVGVLSGLVSALITAMVM